MEDQTPSSDRRDLISPSGILSTCLIKVVTCVKCSKYFHFSVFKDSNIFFYCTLKQCLRTLAVLFNSCHVYKCGGELESSISVSFEDGKRIDFRHRSELWKCDGEWTNEWGSVQFALIVAIEKISRREIVSLHNLINKHVLLNRKEGHFLPIGPLVNTV